MGNGSGPPTGGRGSSRGLLWGLVVAVLLLATVVVGCSGGEAVTVPDLVGMEESKAKEALSDADLALGDVERLAVENATEIGTVLSQAPSPGSEVDSGAEVALVVAKGPEEETSEGAEAQTPSAGSDSGSGSGGEPEEGGGSAADKTSGSDGGSKTGTNTGTETPTETEAAWHTVAADSGTDDYVSSLFTTASRRIQLSVTFSSASGGAFRFFLQGEAAGYATAPLDLTGRPTLTEHTGAPFALAPGMYQIGVDAPEDGEWSFTLREWR